MQMAGSGYELMNMIDRKAKIAGSNQMELLLFTLGGRETFGINVFKVREVCEVMPITAAPNMPVGVRGIISLRGSLLPVIDLATCLMMPFEGEKTKFVITEFSSHTQAFLVENVDRIVRVDWNHVKTPQAMSAGGPGLISALTELPDGRLVTILDVEQVLVNVIGEEEIPDLERVEAKKPVSVFFADDSGVARKRIIDVLEKMGLPYQYAVNGQEAFEKLTALAARASADKVSLRDSIGLILTDAEMPEMDGYVLTKKIKEDVRFNGISVLMHSSLSSVANQKLGQQVGVDAYVPKFNAEDLAHMIRSLLDKPVPSV